MWCKKYIEPIALHKAVLWRRSDGWVCN